MTEETKNPKDKKVCPVCTFVFAKGWTGLDAHWRSKHEKDTGEDYDDVKHFIMSDNYPPNTQQEENIGNTSSPIKETTKVIGGWIAHKGKDPIKIKISLVGAISYNRTTKEMRIVASHGLKVNIPCTKQEYDEVDNATNN